MKHYLRFLFAVAICGFFAFESIAQDIHFSQYYLSPLSLNPALTGSFNGKYRVAANFRNQWWTVTKNFGTPTFMTYSGSFDCVIPTGSSWHVSKLGIGLIITGDQAGTGALSTNQALVSLSYHRSVDRFGKHVVSIGLQGGIGIKRINISDLVFESQLRDLGFDVSIYHGENGFNGKPVFYPDVNAGIMWRSRPSDMFRYSLGFSMYHIAKPKESLLNNPNYKLDHRYVAHASGEVDVSEYFTIIPSFLFLYQAAAQEYTGGIGIRYSVSDETKITAGGYYRHADAFVPTLGVKWKGFTGSFSYDVNFSNLKTATRTVGAMEIALIYVFGEDDRRRADENYCPDF